MLKLTTHICKVTDKTLGVQPKSSCQSVHMSLLLQLFQRIFKFITLLSCYSLNKHMGKCLLISKYQDKRWGYTRGEKTSFGWLMVLWKKQMRSQVLSALRQRQTWEDIGGHQRGYAVKLEAGEEGLRNEVVEWSRIWQALIRKPSYFRNWQRSPMILWRRALQPCGKSHTIWKSEDLANSKQALGWRDVIPVTKPCRVSRRTFYWRQEMPYCLSLQT